MKELNKFQRLRESETTAQSRKFLTFMLGGDECAIDISYVQEIKVSVNLTPVNKASSAPSHMVGMTYLFDSIIPVTDLRIFFQCVDAKHESVIIFLKVQQYYFGIAVDKVMDVVEIPITSIRVAPEAFSHSANNFIDEIIQNKNDLLAILNVEKLYFSEAFHLLKLAQNSGGENVIS